MIRALMPIAVALALALAGCGQKGPLRIPAPPTAPGNAEPAKPGTIEPAPQKPAASP